MSNSYFNFTTGRMVGGENALAEDVNAGFDAVAAGFDKLPTPDATKFLAGAHETTTGSAGNFVLAVTADSYFDGMAVSFKANHSNSGACTLNVGSLGAKSLVDGNGGVLAVGDIVANSIYAARYNSTSDKFHLVGMSSGNAADAAVVAANIADVATIADNIDELLLVDDNAIAAAGSASDASGYANVALTQAGLASDYADAAAESAANLPNATTAGADKILVTNSTGNGWDYVSRVGFGRKNLLINGGFDVWQRGTSFTTEGYTADRWYFRNLVSSGNSAAQAEFGPIEVATPRSPRYCLNLTAAPGNGCSASARMEYLPQFSGKTLTCSFWTTRLTGSGELDVQLNSNFGTGGTPTTAFRPVASSPGGVIFPGTTAFERRTATFTVPDLSSYTLGTTADTSYLELEFSFLNIGASSSICAIADVQLEFGDTATDFEYRHPAEELMLCQRYYERGFHNIPEIVHLLAPTLARVGAVHYKVPKRRTPNISIGPPSFTGHDGTPGVLDATYTSFDEFCAQWSWTNGTVGRAFSAQFSWTADAEL